MKRMTSITFVIFWLAVVGPAFTGDRAAPIAEAERTRSHTRLVHVDGERLTVRLKDVPLTTVLKEIGQRAGVEMVILEPLTKTVSMEFRDVALEEGLQRLLRGCGWISVGRRNGTLVKVIVAPIDERSRSGQAHASTAAKNRREAKGPEAGQPSNREGLASTPTDPARTVAELTEREAIRSFFDVLLTNQDPITRMHAFRSAVNSVKAEEVGLVIEMLENNNVQAREWEVALAPLGGAPNGEARTATIVSSLQNRALRKEVVKVLKQVQLYKTLAEAEGK